jgi:hypothetical protein
MKALPNDMSREVKTELDEPGADIKVTWVKVGIVRNNIVGRQSIENGSEELHKIAGRKSS